MPLLCHRQRGNGASGRHGGRRGGRRGSGRRGGWRGRETLLLGLPTGAIGLKLVYPLLCGGEQQRGGVPQRRHHKVEEAKLQLRDVELGVEMLEVWRHLRVSRHTKGGSRRISFARGWQAAAACRHPTTGMARVGSWPYLCHRGASPAALPRPRETPGCGTRRTQGSPTSATETTLARDWRGRRGGGRPEARPPAAQAAAAPPSQ